MAPVVAAVDCGTNSTRLLVGRPRPDGGIEVLERLMTITRLGEGVDGTGRLNDEAIARTIDVLDHYSDIARSHGVELIRATATSAARDAANSDEFFERATKALGVRPELLSGDDEGRLSFSGAVSDLDPALGPFLVVDIGGGSTEFAAGPGDGEPTGVLSIDVGCVRLTERFLHKDPPGPEELVAAISLVEAYLADVTRLVPGAREAACLVGLAGTVTTVAAVEIGLATYDRDRIHHFRLTRAAIEDVFRTLATESRADRIYNPGLEPERADVIVGGCCVLVALMRTFGFDECLVSEADILDGLALSLV
ncbi:MAG: Ppx/GppA phosphatase family protein [Acidimicrobiales bacterium]